MEVAEVEAKVREWAGAMEVAEDKGLEWVWVMEAEEAEGGETTKEAL